jgi:hypothetical protein
MSNINKCKKCNNEKLKGKRCNFCTALYWRKYRENNKEMIINIEKKRRNTEKRKMWEKQYKEDNREKFKEADRIRHKLPKNIAKSKQRHLKQKYGISITDYNLLIQKQNYQCATCGTHEQNCKRKVLCVDHCHKTGVIRGLLCHNCNVSLGLLKDNIDIINNLINYLKKERR